MARPSKSDALSEASATADLVTMEQEILESRKNYNHIPALIERMESLGGTVDGMKVAAALCRVFVRLLAQGSLSIKKGRSEKDAAIIQWLKDQYSVLKSHLRTRLPPTAIKFRMTLLRAEAKHLSTGSPIFPKADFQRIVQDVVDGGEESIQDFFADEYFATYDDIRYYTFASVRDVIENSTVSDRTALSASLINLLEVVDAVPDELDEFWCPRPENEKSEVLSLGKQKKKAREAWIAVMSLAESKGEQKRILEVFQVSVVPWFEGHLELLADFLTNAYNSGGSMALLALSSIYTLLTDEKKQLDYPSFYPKLYSMLDSRLLHSKGRSQFFRQLDKFLSSTHLSASLVASFIKRLARLSLNAPPGAIVAVVPWIYNQLRKHPACTFLIHRETLDPDLKEQIKNEGLEDPFDTEESDPMKTRAIESSLWELVQLQDHYHPNVAAICKIVSEQFTKNSYNMEDFLDHTYDSLLKAELSQDVKKTPAVEFQIPKRVLLPDEGEEGPNNLLTRIWDFSA